MTDDYCGECFDTILRGKYGWFHKRKPADGHEAVPENSAVEGSPT